MRQRGTRKNDSTRKTLAPDQENGCTEVTTREEYDPQECLKTEE